MTKSEHFICYERIKINLPCVNRIKKKNIHIKSDTMNIAIQQQQIAVAHGT